MGLIIDPRQAKFIADFLEDDKIISADFRKHFENRRANVRIKLPPPYNSLTDLVNHEVSYDHNNQLDVRRMINYISKIDRKLFTDLARFVGERYIEKPAGQLTLMQYRADLARRMLECGF